MPDQDQDFMGNEDAQPFNEPVINHQVFVKQPKKET
jgi:hypothetical protein